MKHDQEGIRVSLGIVRTHVRLGARVTGNESADLAEQLVELLWTEAQGILTPSSTASGPASSISAATASKTAFSAVSPDMAWSRCADLPVAR